MSSPLDHARDDARLGFSVFPVDHPDAPRATEPDKIGKRALVEWKKFQTTAILERDLHIFFPEGTPRNHANVTGAISRIVVVDGDTAEGVAWIERNCPPTRMCVRTGKGMHFYYLHPGFNVPTKTAVRPGIDIRGDGGYVIGRGSVHHTRVVYTATEPWTPELLASLPVFDPAWLSGQKPPAERSRNIAQGSRNDALFKRARQLCHVGLDADGVHEALKRINAKDCDPPLTADEVATIANSALRYGTNADEHDGARIALTFANTIEAEAVEWLWDGRLALGTFALLGGREGIGKTIAAYTQAAAITRGKLPGAFFGTPKTVIVAATEDSWAHTIVPRLKAADADLSRIGRVDVVTERGAQATLSLPRDIDNLAPVIREHDAALVLLDPLMSRLSTKLDTHKDADVRQALEPLAHLAEVTGAVVLGIIHVNKGTSRDPLNMMMGSRAFTAVPRAVLFVAEDPEDESSRVIGQSKNNLGRTDLPTLTFAIDSVVVGVDAKGHDITTGKLRWTGETDRSIRDVVQAAGSTSTHKTATNEAADWLKGFLTTSGGAAESSEIKKIAKDAGHAPATLKRAMKDLGLTTEAHGYPRKTWWLLPGARLDQPEMADTRVTF